MPETKTARYNVTRNDLRQLVTPEATKSWTPVAHSAMVDIIDSAIENAGLAVVSSRIDLAKKGGAQMFGQYTIETGGAENTNFMLGFRNSTNRSLAIGFCAGLRVTVCNNLQFSGDYMTFRKHTSGLTIPELAQLTDQAIQLLPEQKRFFDDRLSRWATVELDDNALREITWELMSAELLPPAKFQHFLSAFAEEREIPANAGQTLATFYNANTRLMRDTSLDFISRTTPVLINYMDRAERILLAEY